MKNFNHFLLENKKFDENKVKELFPGTYIYDGTIETYHLSTTKDLPIGKDFDFTELKGNTYRGGSGDYVYGSDEYNEWVDIFKKETPSNVPKFLYKIKMVKPRYKKSSNLFGQYTPSQFLGEPHKTIVLKYVKELK